MSAVTITVSAPPAGPPPEPVDPIQVPPEPPGGPMPTPAPMS